MPPDSIKTAADFAEREAQLATQEATLKAREEAVAAQERHRARQQTVDFVESLVQLGKVLPVQRDAFVEALVACDGRATVEFSEGDKTVTKTPRAALEAALTAMPTLVEYGEIAKPTGRSEALPEDPREAGVQIAKRAAEYMEAETQAGRSVTLDAAITYITKEKA